jgi:hypothetical protein
MTVVKSAPVWLAAAAYFGAVFAIGFVLGVARVLLLVPRIGERWAELAELPVMVLASVLVARALCARLRVPAVAARRLAMGGLALLAMLFVEFGVVAPLRGLDLEAAIAQRDPVSGTAYLLSLVAFALAPWWVGRAGRPG